jgi:hypothetical protein
MAAATGWETYQANWSLNGTGPQRRLEDAEGILFSNEDINVRITDIGHGECSLQPSFPSEDP